MKSIPLALTWEFWRQSAASLAITIACLIGMTAWIHQVIRTENASSSEPVMLTSLHALCFLFIVVGLTAVVCQSTAAAPQRFTLPVSVRTSVFVPMLNGVLATVLGYLAIALLANGLWNVQWTLGKPSLMAICMISVCQAACSLNWQSPHLRGALVAGLAGVLGVAMIFRFGSYSPERFHQNWQTIQPLDISLAVIVPVLAYAYSVATLALARHGTELSLAAIGRWLLVRLDFKFQWKPRNATPMSAELWIDWVTRGQGLPVGVILVAAVICGFLISGRFEWRSARDMIVALTWMQVILAPVYGLFIGHVGARFDFNEHTATRPLSDRQLADVKLRNTLKAVCWSWVFWAIGLAFGVVCLAIVGQEPKNWSDIIPPGTRPLVAAVVVGMVPLASWTLMSLGVTISILRPWLIKAVLYAVAVIPAVPAVLLFYVPQAGREIVAVAQWSWIGFSIVGTIALYVTAIRLRLMTAKRVIAVGVAVGLLCAIGLSSLNFLQSPGFPFPRAIGFLVSSSMLPFVCMAAVPLAIWWNRHR